jgi:hypothetical protein
VSGVIAPTTLRGAIDLYADSRVPLSTNRPGTAAEKRRTLDLLVTYCNEHGRDARTMLIHEVSRGVLIDFVQHYAGRDSKKAAQAKKAAAAGNAARPTNSKAATRATLAGRTVMKAVGHLADFFSYAIALDAHQFGPRFAHRNLTLRVRSCLSLRGGRSVVGLRECQ